MPAVRIHPQNLTAEQTCELMALGCSMPDTHHVSFPHDRESGALYLLNGWGFDCDHVSDSQAVPARMSQKETWVLGSMWMSREMRERGHG